MQSVELFAGAGGLGLGSSRAGFLHTGMVEWDADSCETLRANIAHYPGLKQENIHECDIRGFDFSGIRGDITLLTAGVPCQPFSIAGKHRGHEDDRNMFPEAVRAIECLKPAAVLIENVRGLARSSFSKYYSYIELMLSYPEIQRRPAEDWQEHRSRLEQYHTTGRKDGLRYSVVSRVLNAADYGVPQKRERVFFVAFRNDISADWSFPAPTHSADALIKAQDHTYEYWQRHGLKTPRGEPSRQFRQVVAESTLPWRTVRDAIVDLGRVPNRAMGHYFVEGAKTYPGHTGSPLDEPSKTLKAGDHGVPGGENMLVADDGSVRYFTVRESARLQTFPDSYHLTGSWTESMRQLGNAVPVQLAYILANEIRFKLTRNQRFGDGQKEFSDSLQPARA